VVRIVPRAPAAARLASLTWFEPDPGVTTPYWALIFEDEAGPIAISWPIDLGTTDEAAATARVEEALARHYETRIRFLPDGPDVATWDLVARLRGPASRAAPDTA